MDLRNTVTEIVHPNNMITDFQIMKLIGWLMISARRYDDKLPN